MPKKEYKSKVNHANKGKTPWNKGIPISEVQRRKQSEAMKGRIPWNKGIPMSEEQKKKLSEAMKGKTPWNKGKKMSEESREKMRKAKEGYEPWNKGKKMSEEYCRKNRETQKIVKNTEEQKQKHREIAIELFKDPKIREKHQKAVKIARNSPEVKSKIDGVNHWNYNPNREEVYAPYGENFYDQQLRNEKWNLQNGRDMLTGTKLSPNKRPAYHHIDYCKSNDDPDNHCFLSINNHARITGYQRNPIKSERYKKVLQENTLALKNGQIPKNWSPLNKELFKQEKLKQLDLSSYII